MNICGEDEKNFVQFLSSESELKLEMKGEAFSPKRGVLFRYTSKFFFIDKIYKSLILKFEFSSA